MTHTTVSDNQKRNKPALPLPWRAEDIGAGTTAWGIVSGDRIVVEHDFVGGDDALYIVHVANLYPELVEALKVAERFCPCGARPESPHSHPHVIGCLIDAALRKAEGQ